MATPSPSQASVLAARLAAQRLSGQPAANVLDATRHLLAVQAQDSRGARLAVRARSSSRTASDVDYALTEERSLIITWVNRGTLHLIAAEDEPLLHLLTTPQLQKSSDRRLQQEGVTPAAARRGIDAIVKELGNHGPMTRRQIRTVLEHVRVPVAGQAMVHILFRATLDGLIVRGPMVGSEHAFVLAADWLGQRPKLDRDRALAELARRYLVAHGPADERDLAKWAQLPLRDIRAGLQTIARELVLRPDGLLDLPRNQPPPLPPARLLGPFDPILLGWRSREFILGGTEDVITANGIFRAIALIDGYAAGTWTIRSGRVELDLWRDHDDSTIDALEHEALAVEAYLLPP